MIVQPLSVGDTVVTHFLSKDDRSALSVGDTVVTHFLSNDDRSAFVSR